MDLIDNKLVVTREYEWILKREEIKAGYYYLSEVFDIKLDKISTKWQIGVFYHDSNENIYSYLRKVESSSNDFDVNYSLFVNVLKRTTAPIIVEKISNGGFINNDWTCFGKHSSVFGHISGNSYTFNSFDLNLKISLKEVLAKTGYPALLQKCWTNNESLFNSDHLSDFTFVCSDDTEIPAHRFILAAHSSVFRTMFNTEMTESKEQMTKLDDIEGDTMLEFLRFLYAGYVKNVQKLAPKLLYCAEKYEIATLKKLCTQEMIKNLSIENVIEYFTSADRFDLQDLAFRCIILLKRNYEAVCQKEIREIKNLKFSMALSTLVREEYASSKITLKTLQSLYQDLPDGYKMFP